MDRFQQHVTIGQAARAADLPVKTIRYYEEIGLIPRAGRTNSGSRTGGHRVFSAAQVGRLRFIRQARLLGLSLSDVRQLLAVADGKGCPSMQPEYQAILQEHLRAIDERLMYLRSLRASIQALMPAAGAQGARACSWEACACMPEGGRRHG